MRHVSTFALAVSLLIAPPLITASLAQSGGGAGGGGGSDVPPATTRAAVPGAVSNGAAGMTVGNSLSPTNGNAGGGMATKSGLKSGGLAHNRLVHHSTKVIPAP